SARRSSALVTRRQNSRRQDCQDPDPYPPLAQDPDLVISRGTFQKSIKQTFARPCAVKALHLATSTTKTFFAECQKFSCRSGERICDQNRRTLPVAQSGRSTNVCFWGNSGH